MALIVILNILSTLYDLWLKLQQPEEKQTNEFYKINPQQKGKYIQYKRFYNNIVSYLVINKYLSK